MADKTQKSAVDALAGRLFDGMTIMAGGFGLCGIPENLIAAIRDDLVKLSPERARTTRYLSFAHLHGAGFCEPQLEGYRHALAKLINHLSLAPPKPGPNRSEKMSPRSNGSPAPAAPPVPPPPGAAPAPA